MHNEADIKTYLAEIGRKGGQKSRRALDSAQAKNMVLVREAKKYYRAFYNHCFWSNDPDYKIKIKDVDWVASELRKHGGREGWEAAKKICR